MHGLEVPAVLAGRGVDGDDGIGEEVVAGTVAAPVVRRRSGHRHVEDAALGVQRHVPGPDVHARAAAPAVIEPGVVPGLAGKRHGVELPHPLAGADVERARVAGRTKRHLASGRAQDGQVSIDQRHAVPRHDDVDQAIASETRSGLSGRRVEGQQPRSRRQQNPRRCATFPWPVGDTARCRRETGGHLMPPSLPAGVGVDREHLIATRRQVHDAVDDDWGHLGIAAGAAGRIDGRRSGCATAPRRGPIAAAGAASSGRPHTAGRSDAATLGRSRRRPAAAPPGRPRQLHRPGLGQLCDVGRIDLAQWREARPGEVMAVHRPVAGGRGVAAVRLPHEHGGHQQHEGRAREEVLHLEGDYAPSGTRPRHVLNLYCRGRWSHRAPTGPHTLGLPRPIVSRFQPDIRARGEDRNMAGASFEAVTGRLGVGAVAFLGLFLMFDGLQVGVFELIETYGASSTWGLVGALPTTVVIYIIGVFCIGFAELGLSRYAAFQGPTPDDILIVSRSGTGLLQHLYADHLRNHELLKGAAVSFMILAVGSFAEWRTVRLRDRCNAGGRQRHRLVVPVVGVCAARPGPGDDSGRRRSKRPRTLVQRERARSIYAIIAAILSGAGRATSSGGMSPVPEAVQDLLPHLALGDERFRRAQPVDAQAARRQLRVVAVGAGAGQHRADDRIELVGLTAERRRTADDRSR